MTQSDKNYWPWFLAAIPLSSVAFGFVMLSQAMKNPDDVVVDNYYKDGMAINQTLAMERKATALDINATLQEASTQSLNFMIPDIDDTALSLRFFHVTDKNQDLELVLQARGNNVYTVNNPALATLSSPGVWYIEILSPANQWRLRERIQTPLQPMVLTHD